MEITLEICNLKEMKLQIITKALELQNGNVVQAAKLLGITTKTIYNRIKVKDIRKAPSVLSAAVLPNVPESTNINH